MLGSEELSNQDAEYIRSVEAKAQVDLKRVIINELEGLSEKDLLAEQGRPHRDLIPRFEEYATTLFDTYAKCRIPKIPKPERPRYLWGTLIPTLVKRIVPSGRILEQHLKQHVTGEVKLSLKPTGDWEQTLWQCWQHISRRREWEDRSDLEQQWQLKYLYAVKLNNEARYFCWRLNQDFHFGSWPPRFYVHSLLKASLS